MEQALAALQSDVVGPLTQQQSSAARRILNHLCETATPQAKPERAADATQDSPVKADDKGLFGIEFRRADEDSKGHDRLKKR